jgi:hypothetical protein
MSEASRGLMTVEDFYIWQRDQGERYELIEDVPVPLRAMTGASNAHGAILVNCIGEFYPRHEEVRFYAHALWARGNSRVSHAYLAHGVALPTTAQRRLT